MKNINNKTSVLNKKLESSLWRGEQEGFPSVLGRVALGHHSAVSQCISIMALRELPTGRFHMPRKR